MDVNLADTSTEQKSQSRLGSQKVYDAQAVQRPSILQSMTKKMEQMVADKSKEMPEAKEAQETVP